jgi:hypothetical protein
MPRNKQLKTKLTRNLLSTNKDTSVSLLQTKHPDHTPPPSPTHHPFSFFSSYVFIWFPIVHHYLWLRSNFCLFMFMYSLHTKWYKYVWKRYCIDQSALRCTKRIVTPSSLLGERTLWKESRLLSYCTIFQGYHVWTLTMSLLWKKFTIFLLGIIISTIKSKLKNINCKKNYVF